MTAAPVTSLRIRTGRRQGRHQDSPLPPSRPALPSIRASASAVQVQRSTMTTTARGQ